MMINLICVLYFLSLSCCLDCALDKDTLLLNETRNSEEQFIITNRGEQKVLVRVLPASFLVPDSHIYRLNQNSFIKVKIKLRNLEDAYDGLKIQIYTYNVNNPNDNQVLKVKVINNRKICTKDDFDIIQGDCNDESYTIISYKYKENTTCVKIPLPQNETAYCFNRDEMKASAIALYVFFGIIALLWFYTIYNVVKLFWIYLQYLPPHFIVGFALGTVFITLYEAARSFVDNSSNCLAILILGAFAHTIHSTCACSTATYMYYEKMKTLIVKNNWLYLSIRLSVTLVLEFIAFGFGYHYYYGFGRDVELESGLTYTMPFCDDHPLCIIYLLPTITWIITLHYYTLYDIHSQSSAVYVFQIWRIGLACIMITYYSLEMLLSKDLFQGKERLLFALALTITHIASHGIFYPLGLEVKDENLRPQLETHILTDDIYRECFRLYLSQDKLEDYLSFWEDCQTFKKFTIGYNKRVLPMLKKIIDAYIIGKSSKRIKLPNELKEEILFYYSNNNSSSVKDGSAILDKAMFYVYNILENHFPHFLKSKQSYYVDIPCKWLQDYKNYHPALQYAIRIRMCENAVTDKSTGFSYQMYKGRIANTNSCYQLSDIPQLLGISRRDIEDGKSNGIKPIDAVHIPKNEVDTGDNIDFEVRNNVYIPQTDMNNENGGMTAYGFATLGDTLSHGSSVVKKFSDKDEYGSLKISNNLSPTPEAKNESPL